MEMGEGMGRPRKYDSRNFPYTLYIKVPVHFIEKLKKLGFTQYRIQKEIEQSKIVENFLENFVEKNSKKD